MPAHRSELVEVASPVGEPELPRGSPVWWWEHYQRHLVEEAYRAPSTIGDYRRVLWDFWASLAPRPPSRATPRDLHRFLGRRTVPGGNSRGLRLAEGTRHVYGGYICSFYRWAAATGRMRRDPMAVVRLPPRRLGPPRALALADVARVLERAARDPRELVMVWLAYGAGLRAGELAGLRTEDVTLGGRPHLRVLGKGRRERLVPLAPQVAVVLAGWLHGRPQAGPLVCSQRDPNRPLQPRTVSALLGDVLKAAGVKASAHQLRHTFATELLAAGEGRNLRAVSRLLGHSSIASTERYTSAYDADAWAAVKLLPDPRAPAAAGAGQG